MDYAALKAELTVDPLGRGYSTMTDQEAAESLNTIDRACRVNVAKTAVKLWALANGVWAAVRYVSELPVAPDAADVAQKTQAKALAMSVLDFMLDTEFSDANFDHPAFEGMMAAMVTAGLMSQAQAAELDAMADGFQSRAVELGLGSVGDGHVASAREAV